jgi:hypothetical protein
MSLKRRVARVTVILLTAVGLVGWWGSATSRAADDPQALEAFRPSTLPAGWTLSYHYPVPEEKLVFFEGRFGVDLTAMVNQVVVIPGDRKVQINYLQAADPPSSAVLYRRMSQMVGWQNLVVQRGTTVIEVICEHREDQQTVADELALTELQRRKLTAAKVPTEWRLVDEFTVTGPDLQQFEERLNTRADELVNQFFLVGEARLQINYIACASEGDADHALAALTELVGDANRLLRRGTIVLEVITVDSELKQQAAALLEEI